MKAAIFSLFIVAFSNAAVWAQPEQSSTTFDLKRLFIEFDEQSRELSYVSFELWPPSRNFVIDCSNSRDFQLVPLPVFPLKIECRIPNRRRSEVTVLFSIAKPLPRMQSGSSARPELDDDYPMQLGTFFAERVYDPSRDPPFGPGDEFVQRYDQIPVSRLAFQQIHFERYQFSTPDEDTVHAQINAPIDERLF